MAQAFLAITPEGIRGIEILPDDRVGAPLRPFRVPDAEILDPTPQRLTAADSWAMAAIALDRLTCEEINRLVS